MALHAAIIVLTALAIFAFSHMLSSGTAAIGRRFAINPSVRGATLDAVGSSFPELCTVLVALHAGAFDAGIGTIAGSALYNILVIPAASVFVGGTLGIRKQVVRRDAYLYLAVVGGLLAAAWLGPESRGEPVTHHLSMWVGLAAVLIYLGYVILLVRQARATTSEDRRPPQGTSASASSPWKVVLNTVVGIAGIGVSTHFLVHSSLAFFRAIGLSEAIAGVTLLAAATSLPDTLMSVFAVRRGDADGAMSNAFGSNSFDILICLGLPVLLVGGVEVGWEESWPLLVFLLVSTLISVLLLHTNWRLTRREGAAMAAIYLVFIVLAFTGVL